MPPIQLAHDPICDFPTKLKLLYTPRTAWDVLRFGGPCKRLPSAPPHGVLGILARTIGRTLLRQESPAIPDFSLPTAAQNATASYGLCNSDPISLAYINATLSYGLAGAPHVHVPLSPFRGCDCPMTVEGAAESDCLLRCDRILCLPRFQLRNRRSCNWPPSGISCTRVTPRRCPLESRAL